MICLLRRQDRVVSLELTLLGYLRPAPDSYGPLLGLFIAPGGSGDLGHFPPKSPHQLTGRDKGDLLPTWGQLALGLGCGPLGGVMAL